MQISRERIRLLLDQQYESGAIDAITGNVARAARGNDMQLELGFGVTINEVFSLLDVSNFSLVTITVKDESDHSGATLMTKTISAADLNLLLTQDQWDAGTHQHCVITFAGSETKLPMNGANEKQFYWSVRVTTNTGTTFTAGDGFLKLYNDGQSGDEVSTPAIGSSLVPVGQTYSGAGAYVLNGLTVGRIYSWTKGASDTNVVNGTETLTVTGYFLSQGTSVTLNGTVSALITAVVIWPRIYTAEEVDGKIAGLAKIIGLAGELRGEVSPVNTDGTSVNFGKQFLRLHGVSSEGEPIDIIKDLTAP